jgi:hypothetical protein
VRTIKDFSDTRLKAWCVHCGGWLSEFDTNRDHAPSKSLLQRPWPDNIPVVTICKPCNESFSPDEEYTVAALSATLSGTTDPERQIIASSGRILAANAKLRTAVDRCRISYRTIGGENRTVWRPNLDRIKRVALKNARGHAYYEIGEPMMEKPAYVNVFPLCELTAEERNEFEDVGQEGVWPEVGSRMMTRLITGEDLTSHGWVMVQEGVYRYSADQRGKMTVRSVLYDYLGTEVRWDFDPEIEEPVLSDATQLSLFGEPA